MTISNNTFNGSWNKGAGGNGYIRGSKLYDSWITGNDIQNVRHITLQWSATGNLVENNTLNCDINLHGGWERNNIIRNNTVLVPYEHQSWSSGAPGTGTWQPFWWASGDHATNWSGPTGPNNQLTNNTFKKALSSGAAINTWGLFDTPNVTYYLGWDGTGYKHLEDNSGPVATWTQQIAEEVYANIPNSGVTTSSTSTYDTDNDGVLDNVDQCPNTPAGATVDSYGCEVIGDSDNDGVLDNVDQCPNTPAGATVDSNGCQVIGDSDNDGVLDNVDQCPNTPAGSTVDSNGCEVVVGGCSQIIDIPWSTKTEVTLAAGTCIRFDRDLSGENNQFWDSDENTSCNFRGTVTSVDGSGSLAINSNYVSSQALSGTTLLIESNNSCPYIKVKAY
ncbi:hypothetical protein C2869_06385 [Saccharobesus litoralis]|uniref:Uncharacterized protein n=2 Tax=Saccharobesus litoralis TaxID=2172099 RepID=A0A2S0VXI7_9ALTE|nr:hypothetical protein C2869_06385 [Saccharobesus litoralis]